MQNLAVQVTSSLLQFPEATIKALQEDEINLESVLRAKFATGRAGLAWLACGPQLEVTNSVTGERLSAYHFNGLTDRPPTVVSAKEFSWQKKTGLLVGLVEAEGSVLCLYDVGISRVVKAVVLPGSLTAVEPIINHGGASASTQHLHQSLRWFFGVAAVVTDVGHVLLIDLCLDDISSNQDEQDASDLEVMSGIPAEIPRLRETATREQRHLGLQLLAPSGTTVSALSYISKTNHLAVGFSDGYLSLWNMKTLRREYHVQIEGSRVPVSAVTFQEPENDPRNCCYLWAVQTSQSGSDLSLHLLQLAFGDRRCMASGQTMYENLEYCEERYSLDLSSNSLSLRGQTNYTKFLSCQTIEKYRAHSEREDGLHEVSVTSPDNSVSVFSWQVNTYGQGKPSIYIGVFDINRWYQAQMPDSLRPGQFLRNCSYFAFWSLEALVNMTQDDVFDVLVHERSLSRGVPPSFPPPEQFYFPSTYNFDATCLLGSGVIHITCVGFQKETLHFLKNSGSSLNETVPDGYNRCLVAGLVSPRIADVQPANLSQEEQLQAVLSAAVETSSISLLTSCIKQWTTEEQPRSASNLRFILEWTWDKVIVTKKDFDRLCVPLFDGSCNFIDPQTLQSLQHCHLCLTNLARVFNCFITEAQELTKQGLIDLTNKQTVTKLLAQYASVVLWFGRCGLLPEHSDETMPLTRPYYNCQRMQQYYAERRRKLEHLSRGKWNPTSLMIDSMIAQFGGKVEHLWQRDEGGTGKYPPANLHALLDLYLLENADEISKHAITIYFLLDIMYSFPDKPDSAIESFPAAFSVPCGLIKLIQGFWLLDHNDYQNSVDCILHPAASRMMTWQHNQIIETLMCQGDHRQALRYIQVMKPPVATGKEVKLHMTVLLANKYIVEAWNLQRLHSSRLNIEDLLKHMYETCQEMGLMEDLLKFTFTDSEQELLHIFLQSTGGMPNQELLLVHHLQRANYIPALQLNHSLKGHLNDCDRRLRERAVARNSILDQYGKILPRVQRTLANESAKPYTLSSVIWKEAKRPKPLSTVAKQAPPGSVITKANFIRNVLMKIKEVSSANEMKDFSPYKSLTIEEHKPITLLPDLEVPDVFFGTPVSKYKNLPRLLDSVVCPVLADPSLLSGDTESVTQRTPNKSSSFLLTSSPLQRSLLRTTQLRNLTKASEFNLLETPLVVRRAKALAASSISSFTPHSPQSILRSSTRITPLASPSTSPGRSVTPPLRTKDSKISFMEQIGIKFWQGIQTSDRELANSPAVVSSQDSAWPETIVLAHTSSPRLSEDMDEDLSRIQDESPSKMDASKDVSNTSARSDQTTLEYHDAPNPEDLEDNNVSVTSKTPPLVNENIVHTEVNNFMIAEEMSLVTEILKTKERDFKEPNLTLPTSENMPKIFNQLAPVHETDHPVESDLEPLKDGEQSFEREESDLSTKDNESVNSIHDSEIDLDQEMETAELHLVQDDLVVKEVPAVVNSWSHCVEIQIVKEKEVNDNISEPEPIMKGYHELFTVREVTLENNIEDTENCNQCEDGIKSLESETDIDVAQNNFTLIIEGEAGEDEAAEPMTFNAEHPFGEVRPESSEPMIQNNIDLENKINEHAAVPGTDQETKIREMLTFVPEPVAESFSENVLNVFKNIHSKDFTAEISKEVVYESAYLKKLRNAQSSSRSPVNSIVQEKTEDLNIRVDQAINPPKKLDEQNTGDMNEIQSYPCEEKSMIIKPPTPRRSIRKNAKASETTDDGSDVLPTTPRKAGRSAKENIVLTVPILQEQELTSSLTRIYRRAKSSVSENPQNTEEMAIVQEIMAKQPLSPARTRRGKASALNDQITNEDNVNLKVVMPLTPTRITRSSKIVIESEKETSAKIFEMAENETQVTTPTRGRREKHVVNELVKHFELNVAQPSGKTNLSPPVSPKRVSLRWTRRRSDNQMDHKTVEEETLKVDTPRKKAKSSTITKLVEEESLNVPEDPIIDDSQESTTARCLTKKTTITTVRQKRKSVLFPLKENVKERLQPTFDKDKGSIVPTEEQRRSNRITRTRAGIASLLPDTSSVAFEFSTPTTRRRKNVKAEKAPSSLEELQPPTTSQFVFSPPSLRTRSTTRIPAKATLKEKDTKVHEFQVAKEAEVPEESLVKQRRGRPPKHKPKKEERPAEKALWSPPPVEIQLLSPPESPTADSESTEPETKVSQKHPLRRNRRRIAASKPVTRRKMR